MSLREFEAGQWIVAVWSEKLGERIYFASTEKVASEHGPLDGVVYVGKELYKIPRMSDEEILTLHKVKKMLGGHFAVEEERP